MNNFQKNQSFIIINASFYGGIKIFERSDFISKFIKTGLAILLTCILLCSFTVHSFASASNEELAPYYVNTDKCYADFMISNGTASVLVEYIGNSSVLTRVEVSVKIQKRFLLVIWNDVDIGYSNNEWTATSYDLNGSFYKEFPISKSGYYRALITVKVYGRSGEVDTIEFTKEYDYR